MTTGGAEIDALQSLFGPLAPVFAVVTQLGDVWFYFTVLSVSYWLADRTPVLGRGLTRPRVAYLVAVAIGAMALVVGLKEAIAVARPSGAGHPVAVETVPAALRDLYVRAATADGYGFPSGHALGTTAIWGGFAWVYDGSSRRRRLALAAGVVALVSLSRLVLGVHYLHDVVGGVLIGFAYLVVVLGLTDTPTGAFGLSTALAVTGIVAGGPTRNGFLLLGFAVGGLLVWTAIGTDVPPRAASARAAVLSAGLGAVLVGIPFGLVWTLLEGQLLVALPGALIVTVLLALPVFVERAVEKGEGRRVQNFSR